MAELVEVPGGLGLVVGVDIWTGELLLKKV
jgi:hypothetical protein